VERSAVSGPFLGMFFDGADQAFTVWQPQPEVLSLLVDFFQGVHLLSVDQRDGF
jgi:hypothetical protein